MPVCPYPSSLAPEHLVSAQAVLYFDANDGGIKRGDRGNVDDTQARPTRQEPPRNESEEDLAGPDIPDTPDSEVEPAVHDRDPNIGKPEPEGPESGA